MNDFRIGEWIHLSGYCPGFFRVLHADETGVELEQIGHISFNSAKLSKCKRTPFCSSQMKNLVGKTIHYSKIAALVLSCANDKVLFALPSKNGASLCLATAEELMESCYTDERGMPLCNIEIA